MSATPHMWIKPIDIYMNEVINKKNPNEIFIRILLCPDVSVGYLTSGPVWEYSK